MVKANEITSYARRTSFVPFFGDTERGRELDLSLFLFFLELLPWWESQIDLIVITVMVSTEWGTICETQESKLD